MPKNDENALAFVRKLDSIISESSIEGDEEFEDDDEDDN